MSKREEKLRGEITELKEQIKSTSKEKTETNLKSYSSKHDVSYDSLNIKLRRTLRGHTAKIYEFDCCKDDPRLLVTSSQDGKLIVWNALSTHKLYVIPLKSQWVLCCAYNPSGKYVVSGGLDNIIYAYKLGEDAIPECTDELKGHEGSVSHLKHIDEDRLLSTSGDKSVILWDLNSNSVSRQFYGHDGDVLSIDVCSDKNTFITGSLDKSVLLWDIRSGKPELSFRPYLGC